MPQDSVAPKIRAAQYRAQIHVIKLESAGFKRRGLSLASMLRKKYSMKARAPYSQIIERLENELLNLEAEMQEVAHG